MMQGWKVFTHDWRSPIKGGAPVFNGQFPYVLPYVAVDRSRRQCGAGWNFAPTIADGLRIAGLWPDGRPSRVVLVEAKHVIKRNNKCRTSTLTLVREASEAELTDGVHEMSAIFVPHKDEMIAEQLAWRVALGRPYYDPVAVEAALHSALATRGLGSWSLYQYETVSDARAARDALEAKDARAARAAWDSWTSQASLDSWEVQTSLDAWAARAAWKVNNAWDAWDARFARFAWDAWGARDALIVFFASIHGLIDRPKGFLATGLRDAYTHGLHLAVPTGGNTLGWAMAE